MGASEASTAPVSSSDGLPVVLVVQADQPEVEQRADHHDDPGALLELGHGEDQHDHAGEEGREPVDHHAAAPVRPLVGEVVLDHARAGHGEAGEHADGVERHQPVDLGLEHQDQGDGHRGQHQDPVGEGQAVAPPGQLPGQVVVAGHEVGQEGEAVEAGVAARCRG